MKAQQTTRSQEISNLLTREFVSHDLMNEGFEEEEEKESTTISLNQIDASDFNQKFHSSYFLQVLPLQIGFLVFTRQIEWKSIVISPSHKF
jgi:hypothetical protein